MCMERFYEWDNCKAYMFINNIYFDYLLECLTYHRFELWNNMVYKQTEDCNVKVTIRKNSAETIWVFYFYKVYEIKNFVV